MKKYLLLFSVLFASIASYAAEPRFYLDNDFKIKKGETKELSVKLENDAKVKGFQITITLPEGLTFVGEEEEEAIATDRISTGVSCAIQDESHRKLIVAFLANNASQRIAIGDDVVFTCEVKADENATLGTPNIEFSEVAVSLTSGNFELVNSEFGIKIYQEYLVTVSSADETMGSVTGGGLYENGTIANVSATPTEGYHFVKWSDDSETASREITVNAATTLTATFAPNQYKATFILGNGDENVEKTQDYKSELKAPEDLVRTGYTFKGWTPEVPATMPINGGTYTATWTPIPYSISYELAGGAVTTANPESYTIESDDIKLSNPTRNGYTFAGWTGTNLTEATAEVTIAKGSTENRSYTATWTPITYTISYELAGGAVTTANPDSYTIESEDIKLNKPTRNGYTFAGWTGTNLTEATAEVTIAKGSTENRSYTATWTPITYTISYELAGGAVTTANPDSYTIESEDIKLNKPTRNGYTFAGWTGTNLTEATAEVTIAKGSTENRSYTATWTPITYTISYELAGGTVATANPDSYTIESNDIKLNNPTRNGYNFAGWTGTGLTEATSEVTIAKGSTENRTYTATWTPINYTISYELAGGAVATANPVSYTIESNDIKLNNPTRNGYTFAGWTGTGLTEATAEVTIAKGSTENRSYTATWTPINYTISYELAGGAVATANPVSYTIESNDIKLNNPTRNGYNFAGWTGTGLTEATSEVTIAKGSTENRTYTATWTPISYTISYELAGGTVATANPVSYTIESDDIKLNNPTRNGYNFAGWTGTGLTEATSEVTIAKGSTENRTYTATWTPINYTISYELAGGAVATANPVSYTIESNDIKLNNPTRNGYTFAGWTGTGLTEATSEVTIAKGSTENRTYTATWTPINYTISYELAGGAVATANPVSYTIESNDIKLNNPTRNGYNFAGWTGTGLTEATSEVTIAKGSTENRTYTATWTPITYTISYELAGGAVATANPDSYTIESDDIKLNNPTRNGYNFAGWTGTGLTEATSEVTIAKGSSENRSYTATWTPITYTISYELAGGAVAMANPTTYNIETNDIKLNNPTRNGYTFAGWTGTGLTEATEEVTIAKGSTENRSYTATWTPINYTISYELAGGAVATANPVSYTIESNDIKLNNPTRNGYNFAGWTGTGLTEATSEVTIAKGSTENRTYTATWTPISYTISYELAGGTVATANPVSYTIESDDIKLNNPTRNGYNFAGWTGTGLTEATSEVTIAKGSTENRTYTATWTPINYTISYELAGGAVATANPVSYTIESNDIKLNNPTRNGYNFAGWTGTGLTEATSEVTIAKGSTENRTYTATWTPIEISIDEDAEVFTASGSAAIVNVKRKITANNWNTICLPFSMTKAMVEEVFGDEAEIAEFTGFETVYSSSNPKRPYTITLNFSTYVLTDENVLPAGKPFLIKSMNSFDSFVVENVTISDTLTPTEGTDGDETPGSFVGTFVKTKVPENALFVNGGKLWYSKGESNVKAFRGWFELGAVLGQETNFDARLIINVDGETTGIDNVKEMRKTDHDVIYNLNGQRVSNTGRGVYIVNGKKVLKK